MIVDETCTDFAAQLAAKQSTPGGGAAAAYVGALAAALASMTGNFTTGKQRYAAYEEDLQRLLADAERVRKRLIQLVDEDAEAFAPLSAAYGIPKDDPSRAAVLEAATMDAIAAPLEMMRQISQAIHTLEEMHDCGSPMLVSDVGCGAALAAGAMRAAALNVYVNTKTLRQVEGIEEMPAEEKASSKTGTATKADAGTRSVATGFEAEAAALLAEADRADALFNAVLKELSWPHS